MPWPAVHRPWGLRWSRRRNPTPASSSTARRRYRRGRAFAGTWHLHTFFATITPDGTGYAELADLPHLRPGPPAVRPGTGNIVIDGGHATFHLTSVTGAEARGPSTSRRPRPPPGRTRSASPWPQRPIVINANARPVRIHRRKEDAAAPPHPVSTAGREPATAGHPAKPAQYPAKPAQYPAKPAQPIGASLERCAGARLLG